MLFIDLPRAAVKEVRSGFQEKRRSHVLFYGRNISFPDLSGDLQYE